MWVAHIARLILNSSIFLYNHISAMEPMTMSLIASFLFHAVQFARHQKLETSHNTYISKLEKKKKKKKRKESRNNITASAQLTY